MRFDNFYEFLYFLKKKGVKTSLLVILCAFSLGGDSKAKDFDFSIKVKPYLYEEPKYVKVQTLSREEIIRNKYNLSEDEFNILCAVILGEAKANSYEDAYAVTNTIYNRTKSNTWINYVNSVMQTTNGDNLYTQVTCIGQFEAYENGAYLKHMDETTSVGYEAILDFLESESIMHEYLSFYASFGDKYGREQFVQDGNLYYNKMDDSDKVMIYTRK